MQYRSPNTTVDSGCRTVSTIVTSRWSQLSDIVHHSIELCGSMFLSVVVFTQLCYADEHIFSIMKVYIERNSLQL